MIDTNKLIELRGMDTSKVAFYLANELRGFTFTPLYAAYDL